MDIVEGVSTELMDMATAHGPKSKEPPFVRAPFPVLALPRVLQTFCQEAAAAMGVPVECIVAPALATLATAIGATTRVRLSATWTEPSVIWAVTLMESGSLKTPAYNAAIEPLRVAQRLAEEQHLERKKEYLQAKKRFETEAGAFMGQGGEPAPVEPLEPKPTDYYTSDSTVEALAMLFDNNPRGLALTRDELSGFFASFGAYKGGRGGDEATYLEFYNAGAVKLNRASGKRIFVNAAALSIFGTCQPAVFTHAIGASGPGANQVENGLAAALSQSS
jgi:hypothetical protein